MHWAGFLVGASTRLPRRTADEPSEETRGEGGQGSARAAGAGASSAAGTCENECEGDGVDAAVSHFCQVLPSFLLLTYSVHGFQPAIPAACGCACGVLMLSGGGVMMGRDVIVLLAGGQECEHWLCQVCAAAHGRARKTKGHTLVACGGYGE